MGSLITQNIVLLGGLIVQIVTLCYLIKYVRATQRIEKETVRQSETNRELAAWQRRQWELDSRKQEWRELIGTLTQCFQKIELEFANPTPNIFAQHTREWIADRSEAVSVRLKAAKVIDDRLFITDQLEKERVRECWTEIEAMSVSTPTQMGQPPPGITDLQRKWAALHMKLVRAAQADLGIAVPTAGIGIGRA